MYGTKERTPITDIKEYTLFDWKSKKIGLCMGSRDRRLWLVVKEQKPMVGSQGTDAYGWWSRNRRLWLVVKEQTPMVGSQGTDASEGLATYAYDRV